MIVLADAISSLRPNIGFVMYDNNPETIIWDEKTETPSMAEIQNEFDRLVEAEKEIKTLLAARKLAVYEKLKLTPDEVEAFLS